MNKIVTKEWLKQKYSMEKKSCQKIGNIVGCSGGWIRKLLMKMKIPMNDRIYNRNKFLNDKKWLNEKYIIQKLSSMEIAKIAKCQPSSVCSALRREGIKIRSKSEASICLREEDGLALTKESMEIISGSLLGDASICRSKKNGIPLGNPYFVKTNKNYDHIEYVARNIFSIHPAKRIFKVKPYKNKRIGSQIIHQNKNGYFRVRSKTSSNLIDLYNKWYIEKIKCDSHKIIPDDLKITPKVLLNWFLDDGYSSKSLKKYSNPKYNKFFLTVELCTNGFDEKDIDKLILKLHEDVGIMASKRRKKRNQFIIHISEKDHEKFFRTIGKCPIKSMEYKWKKVKKSTIILDRWNDDFKKLKTFISINNRFPISTVKPCDEFHLYQWMSTQKMARSGTIKNMSLSLWKIKKLESLPNWKWRKIEE